MVIAQTLDEAESAITAAMSGGRFGDAGAHYRDRRVSVGPEVSFFVVSDGARRADWHRGTTRIFDNDEGPNTGGMGAFAPSPLMTPALHEQVMRDIVRPVIDGMAAGDIRSGLPGRRLDALVWSARHRVQCDSAIRGAGDSAAHC